MLSAAGELNAFSGAFFVKIAAADDLCKLVQFHKLIKMMFSDAAAAYETHFFHGTVLL